MFYMGTRLLMLMVQFIMTSLHWLPSQIHQKKSLRDAGFGYRAKFINQSACKIMQMGGTEWLKLLQSLSYKEAKMELMKLPGIGAKVNCYIYLANTF